MKVHIHIKTSDGLGTDTKGLTIHELSPKEADAHLHEFNRRHHDEESDGHKFIRGALVGALHHANVHVAKHNGEIVGAISHTRREDEDAWPNWVRHIYNLGSIHPGAGHALLRHVADISEKEGSHLQGSPADARVHRLYSNLARRDGGELERIGDGSGYRLKRPKP